MTKKITKLPPLPEDELLRSVMDGAHKMGYLAYHTHDSRHSRAGFPDVTIVGHGIVMFAELKTETGRVTDEQEKWLGVIADLPAPIYGAVVRPSTLDQFLARLTFYRQEAMR